MEIEHSQYLKKANFELLKNLKEVEIDFTGNRLTALVGANGSGKTTVLHALACCFKPIDTKKSANRIFSEFFTPTPDSIWQGSNLTLTYDYGVKDRKYSNVTQTYSKKTDRWSPRYEKRPSRYVSYIGISSCVPAIETERKSSYIRYTTKAQTNSLSNLIKDKAGYIMNRDYIDYNLHTFSKREYIGVAHGEVKYSSRSMSAGEQRVFGILKEVFSAENHALILIDEIDLLMHAVALKKLLKVLKERAEEKSLQIVFTTHSLQIIESEEFVNIRHLHNTKIKTLCFTDTKPEAIYRLTGESVKPLEVFVEDDLAMSIVNHIIERLNLSKYVAVRRYGAAKNCFTVASGMKLSAKLHYNCLFVLDGDEYSSFEAKNSNIKQVLTGTEVDREADRNEVLKCISQFNLPKGYSPERYLHSLLRQSEDINNQIIEAALEIEKVDNSHSYLNDIIDRLNYPDKRVGLSKIIECVSNHKDWSKFIEPIYQWFLSKKEVVIES